MLYFPLLNFYFPSNYIQFLTYLKVANFEFDIPLESEYSNWFWEFSIDLGSMANSEITDQKFIDEEYENTALVTNSANYRLGCCLIAHRTMNVETGRRYLLIHSMKHREELSDVYLSAIDQILFSSG